MSEKQKKNVAVNGAVSQAAGEGKQPERVMTNKMGTMPMNRLLLSMALPMMVSMLVQALYNIVDSVFVSMINENALDRCFPGVPYPVADDRPQHGNRRRRQCGPFQKPGRAGSGEC